MKYFIPAHSLYGNESVKIEVPDTWDVQIASFKGEKAPALTQDEISQKIRAPKGAKPISEGAKGCKTAVILFDDITRPTPVGPIARAVINELQEAGVDRKHIWFIAAVGAHRCMYREDFVRKLGEDIVSEFRVYSHNPFFNTVYLGMTSRHVPVEINCDVVYADYKIGIGGITPHPSYGVGGGCKIVLPGVASLESMRRNHLLAAGKRGDPDALRRLDGLEAAEMLGLDFKIDVMLNGRGEIAHLYSGHFAGMTEGQTEALNAFFATDFIKDADVVLVNNYFKPAETSLAINGSPILNSLKPGGTLIASSHTPQGSAQHYLYGKWGFSEAGGVMYSGKKLMPPDVGRYIVFSKYLDRGAGEIWHFDADKAYWLDKWEDIMAVIGKGDKRLAIYPYGSAAMFNTAGSYPAEK